MYWTSTWMALVDGLDAGDVAGLELLDQRAVDATDEADLVGLGGEGRGDADEERALVLGEAEVGDVVVGLVVGVEPVDHREADVRVVRRHEVGGIAVGEADADDRVVALVGQGPQAVLASRLGLAVLGLGLGAGGGELVDRLLHAERGRVVERLVATAAHVVGQAHLGAVAVAGTEVLRGIAAGGPTLLIGAAGECEYQHCRGRSDLGQTTQDASSNKSAPLNRRGKHAHPSVAQGAAQGCAEEMGWVVTEW